MKYVIVIPGGAADRPVDELGGLSAFQAAHTPWLDRIAQSGRLGTAKTTPTGFEATTDVCMMSILGYDPARCHMGLGGLEAAGLGIELGPSDWALRMDLVTTEGSGPGAKMKDAAAGGISQREARAIFSDLEAVWRREMGAAMEGVELRAGAGNRGVLADRSGRDYRGLSCTAPAEIVEGEWRKHVPGGCGAAELLNKMMGIAAEFLPSHAVNVARSEAGLEPANMCWAWGQGKRAKLPSFKARHGLRGAMLTPEDAVAGIGACIGWDRIAVAGMTGGHDTDYAGQGRAACEALEDYDIVCCHVSAPGAASHAGDAAMKVASIEAIDRHILGPLVERLAGFGDPERTSGAAGWRMLVMPERYVLTSTRRSDPTPAPLAMAGAWVRSLVKRPFGEENAEESDLHVDPGHELMEYFLRGGLAKLRG